MKRLFFSVATLSVICTANAQKVTLDYYFNHEVHQTAAGKTERFHYLWEDKASTGFSVLGDAFKRRGAVLDTLADAPTLAGLEGTAIYIIVDPDTQKENPHPHYIEAKDVRAISTWVKDGGVLLLLANDSANVELPHLNQLAARFGIHFNDDLQNHVVDDAHFADGAINTEGSAIFKTSHLIFMKDICSISLKTPAKAALKNTVGAVIIAIAKYGKGTVLAVGDPWLYNEYTNGRLPAEYENDKAVNDVVDWLIKQVGK
jgi:unsaturated rhamnogalacturonyl hydrolase